ncbi:MAG: hypothetical protein APR55_08060 [Methanolinea sp. SDB]|nr:MAG: hypothetical protein APR55_08060 [Methanolinea sp. SDB]
MSPTNEDQDTVSSRPFWTGTISIGLVNIPVKLVTMVRTQSVSFRLLHKKDNHPIHYVRMCEHDNEVVPWEDVVKGYEVGKDEYVIFEKDELEALKPESDRKIRLDKFVYSLSVDPVYYQKSYILLPDENKEPYSLLLAAFRESGRAGVGRITLRTKEYPALVREYRQALVLTTLHYPGEIVDTGRIEELREMPEPQEREIELATRIIDDLAGEFDINEFHDSYRKRVEEAVEKKLKGETVKIEKPKAEEAKELLEALEETLEKMKAEQAGT